jgi:hypothetical protein
MKPTVTHNPPVMQEVSPATVTLTMSPKAAQALSALLTVVCCDELARMDLPHQLINILDPDRVFRVVNRTPNLNPGHIALRFTDSLP